MDFSCFLKKGNLTGVNRRFGIFKIHPRSFILLGEIFEFSGRWRPFNLETIAYYSSKGIPIAKESPRINNFTALLLDGLQLEKWRYGNDACFFLKLALGGCQRFFIAFGKSLRDAPDTCFLIFK